MPTRDVQFDGYDIGELVRGGLADFRIRLARNERQRHKGHYCQADYFVEVSFYQGFHRSDSKVFSGSGELVL